jgi:hypothetical protein
MKQLQTALYLKNSRLQIQISNVWSDSETASCLVAFRSSLIKFSISQITGCETRPILRETKYALSSTRQAITHTGMGSPIEGKTRI